MLPPKQLPLVRFQRSLVRVVHQAAEARVYQHPFAQMRSLFPGVRMKIDAVLDAADDGTVVLPIDGDYVTCMNRLAVVVAHS